MASNAAGGPVKMKKKQKKNAFMLFCDDQKPRLRKNGFWDGSQAHIVQLCQHEWKNLPESEKELYKTKAKTATAVYDVYYDDHGSVAHNDTRMDSMGHLLADRVNPTEVLNARRKKELDHILKHLAPGCECCDQKFLFIHFEPLVVIDGKWYPCELAIVEYCLTDGVGRSYHKFVHPGKLPVGSKARVKDASEQTHKVPLSGFDRYETDYAKIWDEIITFASIPKAGCDIRSNENYIRPLFTGSLSSDCVAELLAYIASHAKVTNKLHGKVFEVEALCKALGDRAAAHAENEDYVMTQTVAEKCIEHAATAYASEALRCLFHKGIDDECMCSIVAAKKFGFMLSAKLCPAFEIDITERHVPNMGGGTFSMSSFSALRGVSSVPAAHARPNRYPGGGGSSAGFTAQHQAPPSHFAPAREQQREYQQAYLRSAGPPPAAAYQAAPSGRGAGRGSIPTTSSTAPPGTRGWASTAAPIPGHATAAVASPAPGLSRPPGAMAWGTNGGGNGTSSSEHATATASAGGHGNWTPPAATFPAEDVRELEKREAARLSAAMADAALSNGGDDAAAAAANGDADDGWKTAGTRKQKRDLGRGRGARAGPREPLRRPHELQGPRI